MENSFKIYCAGPLFNPVERQEMAVIADVLKKSGFSVFLPQEDGLEFAHLFPLFVKRGIDVKLAQKLLNLAIFSLDVFEIIDSRGLVLNMNGRVPDEGAMVEAGIAWTNNKPIVIFNSDERTLIQGNCNPLVLGLSDFEVITTYDEIPTTFEKKFKELGDKVIQNKDFQFEEKKKKGKTIREHMNNKENKYDLAELLINLFGEELCIKGQGESYIHHNMQR